MANIKFSQFTEKTTLGTVDFLVGYTGAENVQISPTNLLSTFVSGSGTNGQVAYFDPSNNLAGENDFFWDYTNNRLGIGTTSPNRSLHVIGQVAIDNSTSPSGGLLVSPDGTSNKVYSRTGNATSSAHPLDFISGSSTSMRITTAGNVGIGTASPSAKLEVDGTLVATGISQLGSGGANVYLTSSSAGNVGIGNSSPGAKLDVKGDGAEFYIRSLDHSVARIIPRGQTGANLDKGLLSLFDTGSEDVRIDTAGNSWFNGGNVGIGTGSPSQKLEVNGNATFAGDITTNGDVIIDNSSGDPFLKLKTTAKQFVLRIDQSDNEKFQIRDASSSATRFTINNSGDIGIGTTSPNAKLEISDSTNDNLRIGTRGGNINLFSVNDAGAAAPLRLEASQFDFINGNATFAGNVNAGTGLRMYTDGSGNGVIYNLGQDKDLYFVGDDGGTGINALVLDMSEGGAATFAGNVLLGGSDDYIAFNTSGSGSDPKIKMNSDASFTFLNTAGSANLTLDNGGNATFAGNVTATNILTVAGAATGSPYLQFTQGGTQKAYIQYADSGDSFELQSDNQFVVRTGGSFTALTINSSQNATFEGRLTIQDTDTESFRINGTSATGSFVRYQTNGTNIGFFGAAYHLIGSSPAGYENDFGIRAESDLRFSIGASEKMSIINNGNVGIGTTSPASKLEVDGGDIEVNDSASGLILRSPDGTRYRVTVANGGTLSVSAV